MSATRWPASARASARLTATVVLPSDGMALETMSTRGGVSTSRNCRLVCRCRYASADRLELSRPTPVALLQLVVPEDETDDRGTGQVRRGRPARPPRAAPGGAPPARRPGGRDGCRGPGPGPPPRGGP